MPFPAKRQRFRPGGRHSTAVICPPLAQPETIEGLSTLIENPRCWDCWLLPWPAPRHRHRTLICQLLLPLEPRHRHTPHCSPRAKARLSLTPPSTATCGALRASTALTWSTPSMTGLDSPMPTRTLPTFNAAPTTFSESSIRSPATWWSGPDTSASSSVPGTTRSSVP